MKQSTRDALDRIQALEKEKAKINDLIHAELNQLRDESEYKIGSLHFAKVDSWSEDQRDVKIMALWTLYDDSTEKVKLRFSCLQKRKGNKSPYLGTRVTIDEDQIIMPL